MGKVTKALNKIESTLEPDYTSSQPIKKSQHLHLLPSANNTKVINGEKTSSLSHVPIKKTPESQLANKLISAVTDKTPREELIIFVAGTEGMLTFCQNLLEQYDQGTSKPLVHLVNNLCTTKGALPESLYEEVRKVLITLNKFYNADRNQYEILGLAPDATTDEVKNAYRTLSKKFHPESTEQKDFEPRKFHEINGAYHSLILAASRKAPNRNNGGLENEVARNEQEEKSKTKFLTTGFLIVAVLAAAGIYVAERNNSNVMSDQLQTNTVSSIPISINSSDPQPGKIQPTPGNNSDISDELLETAPTPVPAAENLSQADRQPMESFDQREELNAQGQSIETINPTLEISTLLEEYAKLYSSKDLEPLLAFFTETATENGNALTSEIDQYKSLFAHVREIKLTIENVRWTENKDGYLAQATFISNYAYNDEMKRENTGDISFLLTKQMGTLKIQSINYVYL